MAGLDPSLLVQSIALELLEIAHCTLVRRGLGEEQFLQPLQEIARSGRTLADQLLEKYHGEWGGSIDKAYGPELTY